MRPYKRLLILRRFKLRKPKEKSDKKTIDTLIRLFNIASGCTYCNPKRIIKQKDGTYQICEYHANLHGFIIGEL